MRTREQNIIRLKKVLLNDKSSFDSSVLDILNNSLYDTLEQFFDFDRKNLSTEINFSNDGYLVKINLVADKVKEFGKIV